MSNTIEKFSGLNSQSKLQQRCQVIPPSQDTKFNRRNILLPTGASLIAFFGFLPLPIWAKDGFNSKDEDGEGVVGVIKSLFDSNEKTKSGKVLPKAYLKSAREVVKTLRESLKEDAKDIAKFRRTADAAKESIRDYLNNWKGQGEIANEESYVMLERAIRRLANFYSKAGPSASLPDEVKTEILNDLSAAEEFL